MQPNAEQSQEKLEDDVPRTSRLEAIAHLAAGVAHKVNTPIQYVGDNIRFLEEGVSVLQQALAICAGALQRAMTGELTAEDARTVAAQIERLDVAYFVSEAPLASSQALEGVRRVSEIVCGLSGFAHRATAERVPEDILDALRNPSVGTVPDVGRTFIARLAPGVGSTA